MLQQDLAVSNAVLEGAEGEYDIACSAAANMLAYHCLSSRERKRGRERQRSNVLS